MKEIINSENLEKLLSSRWTEFLDIRKIMAFTRQIADEKLGLKSVHNISISRFEIKEIGFILWIEFNTGPLVTDENKTIEAFLTNTGELTSLHVI